VDNTAELFLAKLYLSLGVSGIKSVDVERLGPCDWTAAFGGIRFTFSGIISVNAESGWDWTERAGTFLAAALELIQNLSILYKKKLLENIVKRSYVLFEPVGADLSGLLIVQQNGNRQLGSRHSLACLRQRVRI